MSDYRSRIYQTYAFRMQNGFRTFDEMELTRWGRAYDTYLGGWLPQRKEAAILDIACGGGKLLYFLKSRGYINVQGVDISPEQVILSKQVIAQVVERDAVEFLQEHPESFDLIIGLDIVEHFLKDEALGFLEACYRALLPSGRLILQTPNAESPWGMMHRYNDFTHEIAFNSNSMKRLLEFCGFSEIELRQAGPVVHGLFSLSRYIIWKVIWIALALWNLAETGSIGSGVYTRIFLISGTKG